jgi:peptide/nickel transport system permease protein
MLQYTLRRLLLMVPTFLFITVVVFAIINIAPGRPPQAGGSGSESADQTANAREGYRLFKEQYYLDRPIVLNFRFLLTRDRVAEELDIIARNMSGAVPGEAEALHVGRRTALLLGDIRESRFQRLREQETQAVEGSEAQAEARAALRQLDLTAIQPPRPPRPRQAEVFRAEERVENWGRTIVPHLMEILRGGLVVTDPRSGETRIAWEADLDPGSGPVMQQTGFPVRWQDQTWHVHGPRTQKLRFLAAQRLSVNARSPLVVRPGEQATEAERSRNAEVSRMNAQMARWTWALGAPEADRDMVIASWESWWDTEAPGMSPSLSRNLYMLFLETRFARYFANLLRLDFGTSIRYNRPVMAVIGEHWQYSIYLSLLSLLLSYFISVPIGVLAAVKQNQFADRGVGVFLFVLYSLPSFFAATMMQTWLTPASSMLPLFPVSGFTDLNMREATTWAMLKDITWHLVLPVVCLTYGSLAVLSRYARTGLLDVIRSDYIRTARAKGLSEWVVIGKHAVRNGMIPILTLLGTTLPVLIGGSIIIEFIFNIEGMGKLMITAIQFRDYNIIMGVLLISSVLTLIGLLLSDLSYALVDPRISLE